MPRRCSRADAEQSVRRPTEQWQHGRSKYSASALTSSKSFEKALAAVDAAVGHPDFNEFRSKLGSTTTYAAMEKTIREVIGPSGLMEFIRFDHGEILRKESGKGTARIVRLVVGNPLIMKQMVEHVPDAGSYAPVTILIDERSAVAHLSYDTMGSILAPYGSSIASNITKNLDEKIKALLEATAK